MFLCLNLSISQIGRAKKFFFSMDKFWLITRLTLQKKYTAIEINNYNTLYSYFYRIVELKNI